MPDHESSSDQLHPKPRFDQTTQDAIAPAAEQRTAEDVSTTPDGQLGAVETEVTPLTPPAANTETPAAQDAALDPGEEITPG